MRNVFELAMERDEQIGRPPGAIELGERGKEMQCPDPRDAAKPELEHACPVHPCQGWICIEPAPKLAGNGQCVTRLVSEPRRAAEREPVLVAIQLPDDFVVAVSSVEIRHAGPEPARHRAPVYGIEVPVKLLRIVREAERGVAEEVVSS